MPSYSAREQARNTRWREKQRKRQADPKPEEQSQMQIHPKPKPEEQSQMQIHPKPERSAPQMSFDLNSMFQQMQGWSPHPYVEFQLKRDTEDLEAKRQREAQEALERQAKAQQSLDRLATLPGMDHIKAQVEQILALRKVSDQRKAFGLKTEPQTLHMVFKGNPGTGKTTAARLIGEAFINLGLLKNDCSKAPFIEIHHNDIEDPAVGIAERKLEQKFKEARGGVLFIDEAYAFIGPHSFHKSIIATLVSCMEDMRDEILVVVAGYNDEMEEFLDMNPGLRSRFTNTIDFPDFELGSLLEIADLMAIERDYSITSGYRTQLIKRLELEKKSRSFGNARTVRNIIEQSIRIHAVRMSEIENPTKEQLTNLLVMDVDTDVKPMPPKKNKHTNGVHGIMMVEVDPHQKKDMDFHL